jgi:catechol 2,3-dioxygenase-like lactoylglutathione lyase family enzyme
MTITRVERVVYGVADLDECTRFFEDFGLERGAGTRFATQTGQVVELRAADDAALPPAVEDGSTIREVVWGVARRGRPPGPRHRGGLTGSPAERSSIGTPQPPLITGCQCHAR